MTTTSSRHAELEHPQHRRDAVYLSLGEKRDLPLVTLDDALRGAAGKRSLV